MKVYAGAPAAARHYVEADRSRADDYYLAEGTGLARRYTAGPDGGARELAPLTGETYEAWVAGLDPQTRQPRGWLRTDAQAVRFVEVVVNGPKSWTLAAALHPDIAAAYDAAQDRAAGQVIGWLAGHATTRVGPRGGQVQMPVECLEAVTVAHHTSRAGDPHRHLHLQINARVFAAGKWRGLHTVGVRDSLAAINGIGHAAIACDPQFRAALAAHGYSLNNDGEIRQLADFVGAFSARTQQIARNIDTYEREWTAAHPDERPGPGLRGAWDARAWADGRPDKVTPQPGEDLTERWLAELAALGYRDRDRPVDLTPTPVGHLDREQAVHRVLARLAAARSAWNPADIRGEVEQLLAAAGVVADPAVRIELAEDLTARALDRCLPLLDRDGIPEHIRAWTSAPVLEVEADLTARLTARATEPGVGVAVPDALVPSLGVPDAWPVTGMAVSGAADRNIPVAAGGDLTLPDRLTVGVERLDAAQAAAAAVLAGDRRLVVIEGAAGAGKTTTLAATRQALAEQARRLVVVTPTLKAAKVAAAEVGTAAGSAAWLAFQHGWRWDGDGAWTRLAVGQADPATGRVYEGPTAEARLRPRDLLVVDEAGMLDQDTARALLTVADECQVRVALLGDRHQLAAVGRGGVLDLAAAQVDPTGHLMLDGVHRFTRTDAAGTNVPDREYADLTLAMRAGADPGVVFDALAARGQIRLHPDDAALREALAVTVAASCVDAQLVAVVVDTREQAQQLNGVIRGRLGVVGRVDDSAVVTTRAGERIGAGDRVATRRNDRDLGVANRDTWLVTAVGRDGRLTVTPADLTPAVPCHPGAHGAVTPTPGGGRVLPADYVTAHVELAYASTAHAVQGDTVTTAHTVIGEHTGAASAYVGMTRGREANTAHLVAEDLAEAREQWLAVFARDRADLGPAHATRQAAAEAARYAQPRPLSEVLAELEQARSVEWGARQRLAALEPRRDALAELATSPDPAGRLATLLAAHERALSDAARASRAAEAAGAVVTADADRIRSKLLDAWFAHRGDAADAARTWWAGPGRFGVHRGAVRRAEQQLTGWADSWRPLLPAMPTDPQQLAEIAGRSDYPVRPAETLAAAARAQAEQAHPEHAALAAAAAAAEQAEDRAWRTVTDARRDLNHRASRFGQLASLPDPAVRLADTERDLTATRAELTAVQDRIAQLRAEPAYRNQPSTGQHSAEQRSGGRAGRRDRLDGDRHPLRPATWPPHVPEPSVPIPRPQDLPRYGQRPGRSRGRGR